MYTHMWLKRNTMLAQGVALVFGVSFKTHLASQQLCSLCELPWQLEKLDVLRNTLCKALEAQCAML